MGRAHKEKASAMGRKRETKDFVEKRRRDGQRNPSAREICKCYATMKYRDNKKKKVIWKKATFLFLSDFR